MTNHFLSLPFMGKVMFVLFSGWGGGFKIYLWIAMFVTIIIEHSFIWSQQSTNRIWFLLTCKNHHLYYNHREDNLYQQFYLELLSMADPQMKEDPHIMLGPKERERKKFPAQDPNYINEKYKFSVCYHQQLCKSCWHQYNTWIVCYKILINY